MSFIIYIYKKSSPAGFILINFRRIKVSNGVFLQSPMMLVVGRFVVWFENIESGQTSWTQVWISYFGGSSKCLLNYSPACIPARNPGTPSRG